MNYLAKIESSEDVFFVGFNLSFFSELSGQHNFPVTYVTAQQTYLENVGPFF